MNDNKNHTLQSAQYPETHYTYSHPVLSPIGYHLDLSAVQPLAASPSSEGTISPTSHSEIYASSQHSSIGIPAPGNPLSWSHPAPGTGLPDELNSPKPSPVQYTSHLPYPHSSSGLNTPFMSVVHSPATGSPALHMSTFLPEQAFSAYPERPLTHIDPPREQYVNMSDVASLGGDASSMHRYPSPHALESNRFSSANFGLGSQEDFQGTSRRGNKRTRAHDSLEVEAPAVKRPRGRPRKDFLLRVKSKIQSRTGAGIENVESDEEIGGDGDSDSYVPSRSTSPPFQDRRKRMSDSSYESSASGNSLNRNSTRATFSLRQFEELSSLSPTDIAAAKGLAQFDFTHGGGSGHSNPGPTSSVAKKSRGRKVPVDGGAMTNVHTSGAPSAEPSFNLNSPNLYTLPDPSNSTGGDDSTSQYEGGSHSQYANYEGSWPSYPQASSVGETSAPKQGRPPARGRYANNTEVRVVSGGIKKATGDRRYVCTAPECGKCFVRGEHLKRHVRSLHSWEKPHKCLHPGCNKSFSRRDNLGQHARVHL
ncbi:hypothetical protein LENED_003289 [Lentinula edodes]|uniref:C2H2-type domain-containing protein n=2 Tax=Lentinula TaxID=5352 RepID=A0A1Q3E3E1_LENED|nr:hypothetical protein LENED_003289 [Lentinula edodes]